MAPASRKRVPKLGLRGNVFVICIPSFRTIDPILSDSRVYKNEKFPDAAPVVDNSVLFSGIVSV